MRRDRAELEGLRRCNCEDVGLFTSSGRETGVFRSEG
jgi:hypothetical protein